MENINIMPGIDFKANKERMRSKKRKIRRINKILNGAIIVGLLVGVIGILILNKNMTDSAMQSCQDLGNTYEFCIAHV